MSEPSELVRFLRAYRRFLEHAADAAALAPDELVRMRESEAFYFIGTETPARAQATESLQAVRLRAERLGDQEALRFGLGLILENLSGSLASRLGDSERVERIAALEQEVKRLRQGGPVRYVDDDTPSFFQPDRQLMLVVLRTLSKRYLRQLASLRDTEEGATTGPEDDAMLAIAAIYQRQSQQRGKRRKSLVAPPLLRRWADVALPEPESLDAAQMDRLGKRLSLTLEASLAALAPEGPPGDAWGWTIRGLARAWSRDLGLSILATRVLARAFFQWLQTECRGVFRSQWGSLHLIENRRLVIEEKEGEPIALPSADRANLVELFPHP